MIFSSRYLDSMLFSFVKLKTRAPVYNKILINDLPLLLNIFFVFLFGYRDQLKSNKRKRKQAIQSPLILKHYEVSKMSQCFLTLSQLFSFFNYLVEVICSTHKELI